MDVCFSSRDPLVGWQKKTTTILGVRPKDRPILRAQARSPTPPPLASLGHSLRHGLRHDGDLWPVPRDVAKSVSSGWALGSFLLAQFGLPGFPDFGAALEIHKSAHEDSNWILLGCICKPQVEFDEEKGNFDGDLGFGFTATPEAKGARFSAAIFDGTALQRKGITTPFKAWRPVKLFW